jgi:hypothetical protein
MPRKARRSPTRSWLVRTLGSPRDIAMAVLVLLNGGQFVGHRRDEKEADQRYAQSWVVAGALSARVDSLESRVRALRRDVRSLRLHGISPWRAESVAPHPDSELAKPHGELLSALRKLWPWSNHG